MSQEDINIQNVVSQFRLKKKGANHCGSTVVKVLCYKSEGCWFDPS